MLVSVSWSHARWLGWAPSSSGDRRVLLGLVYFNPGNRRPIVVKGLIIPTVLHATYNASVGLGIEIIRSLTGVSAVIAFLLFVLGHVGAASYLLYRENNRYRTAVSRGMTHVKLNETMFKETSSLVYRYAVNRITRSHPWLCYSRICSGCQKKEKSCGLGIVQAAHATVRKIP